MDIITIRYTTHWPWNPTSLIIAKLSGSPIFSHTMAIINGSAYEATMLHGCRTVPIDIAMQGVAKYQDMYIPVADIKAGIAFGDAQNGKGYDFAGAIGIPLTYSTEWADNSKWWCSEETFMLIGAAGVWMLNKDEETRITPEDLLKCNYDRSEVLKYDPNSNK